MNISGASRASYSVSNAQPIHAGSYTVRVSNNLRSVISSAANLAVNFAGVPPRNCSLSTNPSGSAMTTVESKVLSVSCTDATNAIYVWKKNGAIISGANNYSLSISNFFPGVPLGAYFWSSTPSYD